MNIILAIGIRNLLRQKRRNILLGTGIAFGMMILVLSSAFSEGLSDVLFNKIIVHFSGHIQVVANEVDKKPIAIIRDRNRIEEIIRKNVSGLKDIWEDVLSFARIQGNGKSEFSIVVGMKPVPASFEGTQFVEGGIEEFSNGRFTCPIIMYKNTATSLRLKLHDTIRLRLETTSGQIQTATGIIVGIAKSDSMFDAMTMYMPIELLKTLMGFKPWETGSLKIILKEPLTSREQADRLHQALIPTIASALGQVQAGSQSIEAHLLGFETNLAALQIITRETGLSIYLLTNKSTSRSFFANSLAARQLGLSPGMPIEFSYARKFGGGTNLINGRLAGIFEGFSNTAVVLLREHEFNPAILKNLPKTKMPKETIASSSLQGVLAREWRLLPRSATSEDLQTKIKQIGIMRYKGSVVDVRTMYESASIVLKLEGALDMLTFVAVLVLFMIILIGVVNSLRMTIRERTREIGTMRAIGMQQKDVRNLFLFETFFLALFASLVGVILGLLAMALLGSLDMTGNAALSMLLVNGQLYFLPTLGSILSNIFLITLLTLVTAWVPARKAAKLTAAAALRHYE